MARLRIESIRIVENNENHKAFCNALHIFDLILSGEHFGAGYINVSENKLQVITSLIQIRYGEKSESNMNQFILNCFDLYLLQKRNIVILPGEVYRNKIPLLFYEIRPKKAKKDVRYVRESQVNKYYFEYVGDDFHGLNLLRLKTA